MANPHNHPYYPVDAQIPGYSPNGASLLTLLACAAAASAALLGVTWAGISLTRANNLRKADRVAILWFVLCMKELTSLHPSSRYTILIDNSWHPSLLLRGLFYPQS